MPGRRFLLSREDTESPAGPQNAHRAVTDGAVTGALASLKCAAAAHPGDPGLIQRIQTVCESIYTEIQRMVVGNGGHIHTDFLKNADVGGIHPEGELLVLAASPRVLKGNSSLTMKRSASVMADSSSSLNMEEMPC